MSTSTNSIDSNALFLRPIGVPRMEKRSISPRRRALGTVLRVAIEFRLSLAKARRALWRRKHEIQFNQPGSACSRDHGICVPLIRECGWCGELTIPAQYREQ